MIKIKNQTPCLFYPITKEMGVSVSELLTNSEVQKDALICIANKYPADAVIRMTELWCEAASFGMKVTFQENDFPKLGSAIISEADDFENIIIPDAVNEITKPLIDAVKLAKPKMNKPLIVGVTAPFTLASVLNGSEDFMVNSMTEPEMSHAFLEKLTGFLINYINEYKKAGADGIILAEPSVTMISPDMTDEFSNTYIEKIITAVQTDDFSVIYHNCGAVNSHMEVIAKLSAHGFHFGCDVDMKTAINKIPNDRLIMGNVDPRLFLSKYGLQEKISQIKSTCSGYSNFVLSTGCDLSPNATKENIATFFNS